MIGADAEDVGVVVLSGGSSVVGGGDEGGADIGEPVGGDAHAYAAFAHEDTEVGFACCDAFADGLGEVGVIDAFGVVRAEVRDEEAGEVEVGEYGLFEVETAVIGADGDA